MVDSHKVKIKSVYNTDGSDGELVVKIKNDYVRDCSGFDFNVFADKNDPSRVAVTAVKGDSFYAGNCEPWPCRNYLIIVNKKKSRARLLPVNVCDLSQVKTREEKVEDSESNVLNRGKRLTDKFGSKRSKRKMDLTNRMRVNAEACEVQLKPILDETVVDESYLEDVCDGTESLERLIPPCNRSSSTVDGVYDLNDLLTENERDSLKEAAENLLENAPVEEGNELLYVHYNMLGKGVNVERLILLLYVDCLMRLLKMHKSELKRRDAWNLISPHSKLVLNKIRREFTEHKVLTSQMQHKVICHALVALMLACGYKIHLDKISSFLRGVNNRKLQQLCSLVGATPQSKASGGVYSLKVPLPPLPVAKSPIKKKKR